MPSKRKTSIEEAKASVKKATNTSRPMKYIQRQQPDLPKSRTPINPNRPKTPVKGSNVRTSGLSGRAIGDVGRIGGGGLPEENR